MNYTKKITTLLLFISMHLGLCACGGEAPPQFTTDNRPTVIFTETTAVLNEETTTSESEETLDEGIPIINIDPVSEDEVAKFLFSKVLRIYNFNLVNDREEYSAFMEKTIGGTSFVVNSLEELDTIHRFLEASSYASYPGETYNNYTKKQLYGDISADFFDSSVLVFYIAGRYTPTGEVDAIPGMSLGVKKCSGNLIILSTGDAYWDRAHIPEENPYEIGVSCWTVSREALTKNEIWFRSPCLGYTMYDWFLSPYTLESLDPDEITPELKRYAEKCFAKIDDPSILPVPEEYKPYVGLEGNIVSGRRFGGNTAIGSYHGFIKTESDFENLIATFESVLDLPPVEYELEDGLFEEYDILYVVGYGGAAENYYYTVLDDTIELHILPQEGEELYITLFRVSKDLGDYYNIDLRFLK